MKHTLLSVVLLLTLLVSGCKKQILDKGGCYECKGVDAANQERYVDIGCMTANEWKEFTLTDYAGNDRDENYKYANCRKRR